MSILIASAKFLHFCIQEGDNILEHANGKCHLCILWSTCRPLCHIARHAPHNTIIEHTHAKVLVIALECQVSWVDTYDEDVNHQKSSICLKIGKVACDTKCDKWCRSSTVTRTSYNSRILHFYPPHASSG